MIDKLKNVVFVWGLVVSTISGTAYYVTEYSEFITTHPIELGIMSLIFATWVMTHFKFKAVEGRIEGGIRSIQVAQLKSDVDRFFKDHKRCERLSEDEAQYLYMLRDKLKYYEVNSFTERKVNSLLKKDIK